MVQQAENGRVLLDGIEQFRPDVVLLDMDMPVLGGADTLVEIRKNYDHIRVLMLTMHNNEAFILQMMDLGATATSSKIPTPRRL